MSANLASAAADMSSRVRESWLRLIQFCNDPAFAELVRNMWALPSELQHEFTEAVFLNPGVLKARGINVPDDIVIQRSWFEDERPTVFCVCAKLPAEFAWDKITVTFDAPSGSLNAPLWR